MRKQPVPTASTFHQSASNIPKKKNKQLGIATFITITEA